MGSWWASAIMVVFLGCLQFGYGEITCSGVVPMKERAMEVSITDFGGVGDGVTLNTDAFRGAVGYIKERGVRGGAILSVPAGVWLTGSFNLTSHMTLFLAKGAVIKASQDSQEWPLIDPLPSYGRGRERLGGRYISLIHGAGIHDVVITGENGTIDGQGEVWWNMWRQRTLLYTRPSLVELMHSRDIIISNLTFRNSPFWNIHPVYCSNVVIRNVTVLAPQDSPNTDGVDPDSSSNVCIEDSYMSTGDDLVAVKSGWDEYGIAFNRSSHGITVRRLTGSTPFAGIAVGSETSGGVENVLVENVTLYNVGVGIHVKTNVGRGSYIKNVTILQVNINGAHKGIKIAGDVGDHPDDKFNMDALPVVDGILISHVRGTDILQPGLLRGLKNSTFTNICLMKIKLDGVVGRRAIPWNCADVSGDAIEVEPTSCLKHLSLSGSSSCSRLLRD